VNLEPEKERSKTSRRTVGEGCAVVSRERGETKLGCLVLIVLVAILGYLCYRVIPVYLERDGFHDELLTIAGRATLQGWGNRRIVNLVPFIEQRLAQETADKTRSTRDQNTHQFVKLEGLRVRCKSTRSLKRETSNGDLESPTSVLETKGTRGDGAKIKLIHVTSGEFLGSTIVHHKNHLWSATDMLDLDVLRFDCEVAVLA